MLRRFRSEPDRRLLGFIGALVEELEHATGWDEEQWLVYLEQLGLNEREVELVREHVTARRAIRKGDAST